MLIKIALIVGAAFFISKQFPDANPNNKLVLVSAGSIIAFKALRGK